MTLWGSLPMMGQWNPWGTGGVIPKGIGLAGYVNQLLRDGLSVVFSDSVR